MVRYNGINESSVFKNPSKLPAIVHFTSADLGQDSNASDGSAEAPFGQNTSNLKESTEFQFTRNHMLESSTTQDFKEAVEKFIKE